jgi:uncharacterized protein YciI
LSNIDIKEVSPTREREQMALFVVIEEQGPGWDPKRVMREQKGWTEHANFMDALDTAHFVLLGGTLKYSKHRAMLIVNASSEQELRKRLADDPWMRTGVLRTIEIYPWEILLGKLS